MLQPENLQTMTREELAGYLWGRLRFEEPLDPPLDTFRRQEPPEEFLISTVQELDDPEFSANFRNAIRDNLARLALEATQYDLQQYWKNPVVDQQMASLAFLISATEDHHLLPFLEHLITPWLPEWRRTPTEPSDGQFQVLRTLAHLQEGSALEPLWRDLWEHGPPTLKGIAIFGLSRANSNVAVENICHLPLYAEHIDLLACLHSLLSDDGLGAAEFSRSASYCDEEQFRIIRRFLQELGVSSATLRLFDSRKAKHVASQPLTTKEELLRNSHLGATENTLLALKSIVDRFEADLTHSESPVQVRRDGTIILSIDAYTELATELAGSVRSIIQAIEKPLEIARSDQRFDRHVAEVLRLGGWVGYALGNEQHVRAGFRTFRRRIGSYLQSLHEYNIEDKAADFEDRKIAQELSRCQYLPLRTNSQLNVNQTFMRLRGTIYQPPLGFVGLEGDAGFSLFVTSVAPEPAQQNYDRLVDELRDGILAHCGNAEVLHRHGIKEVLAIVNWLTESNTVAEEDFFDRMEREIANTLDVVVEEVRESGRVSAQRGEPVRNVDAAREEKREKF